MIPPAATVSVEPAPSATINVATPGDGGLQALNLRWLARFAKISEALEATKTAKSDPVNPVVMEDGSHVSVDPPC